MAAVQGDHAMKSSQIALRILFALPLLATWACSGEIAKVPGPGVTAADVDTVSPADAPTYTRDIAPILRDKCVGCHRAGGLGPFALTTYAQARTMAFPMASATSRGIMPPYLVTHDGSCGDYEDAETLTPDQIAVIQRWASTGQSEGKPGDATAAIETRPTTPTRPPTQPAAAFVASEAWQTPHITPVAAGGPLAQSDDYRCFPLATKVDHDQFIVGSNVLPGNATLVHHVELFIVHPDTMTRAGTTNAAVMDALDKADPQPGWPCFGDAGQGVEQDGSPAIWAPGQGAVMFPAGMGFPIAKGDRVVAQIHYNLDHPGAKGQSDSTTVQLAYVDTVERRLMVVAPDKFLDTVTDAHPASLPPGDRAARTSWTLTAADLGGDFPDLEIIAVMPHMHGRGVREEMKLAPGDGSSSCMAEVEQWNFHWQKFYFFASPRPVFTTKSQLAVTCEYDTSKDRAPILPGWGTGNEMCAAIMLIALPPGM
jgi:hypothetical protein